MNALVEEGNHDSVVCNNKKEKFGYYILWSGLVYHGLTKRHIKSCVTQFIGTPFPGHCFGTSIACLRMLKLTH